jgi:hypothetical protein
VNRRAIPETPPAYLSRCQLARRLSCSTATIRRLERRGVIRPVMVGNYPRYAVNELAKIYPGLNTI